MASNLIPQELIEKKIFLIRGRKAMLSSYLAELYKVEAKRLIQAVKRNKERFPDDFMFQLTREEMKSLRSQIVTLNNRSSQAEINHGIKGRGQHPKYAPYAFTEQGVAMLSSVLRSRRAIQVNIAIMRALSETRP